MLIIQIQQRYSVGDLMIFDTFDEGVAPGGLRTKKEIKTLICYLFFSVKENMSKEVILQSIQQENLANYFETSVAFDDLIKDGHIVAIDDESPSLLNHNKDNADSVNNETSVDDYNEILYHLTDSGMMIAEQLETTIAYTAKEKSYNCAIKILAEKKKMRYNSADIIKTDIGYDVLCKISGGDMELLTFKLYAPTFEQASIMKKNFCEKPSTFYKTMLALIIKDKETVGEALEDLYDIL